MAKRMTPEGRRLDQARAEEEARLWVEADLRRLEQQKASTIEAVAEAQRRESQRLEELMPVSARLAEMFREVERRTRSVRSCRLHEVAVRLRQPSVDCIHVSLRWGKKFDLTDADKQLMSSYKTRRRRLQRYPDVVVGHEYCELSAVLDARAGTLRLGSGTTYDIAAFVANPSIVDSYIHQAVANPSTICSYYRRCDGYEKK